MEFKEVVPHVKAAIGPSFRKPVKDGFLTVMTCRLKDTAFLKGLMKKTTTVSFENPPEAVWFLAFSGFRLVGCCCAVIKTTKKGKTARFKSDVVDIEFRGRGYYQALSDIRLNHAQEQRVKEITCFSTLFSRKQFLNNGFKEDGVEKNGVIYMRKQVTY